MLFFCLWCCSFIIYFQCCYYYYSFFCLFFNWWSVCNFTEYVRRLDEILAQKIEKFTQLRGKTALLTIFSASLLACCCVKHTALCSLDLKGEFFNMWTKTYFWSSLPSTRVKCVRRLGIFWLVKSRALKSKTRLTATWPFSSPGPLSLQLHVLIN